MTALDPTELNQPGYLVSLIAQCIAINQARSVIPDDVIADLQKRLRLSLQLPDPKAVKP